MKKSLIVLAVLVVACGLSFAQAPGTYSFWNSTGSIEYCNYNVITFSSGGVVAGYDNTTSVCGFSYNSAVIGMGATTPASSLPAHGKGAVTGDGIYDASCICYSGLQWTVWLSQKPSARNKQGFFHGKWGWVGVAGSYTGTYFGNNYGYLGAGYPSGNVASHGTTAGKGSNHAIQK